jgi:PKD repeat protein
VGVEISGGECSGCCSGHGGVKSYTCEYGGIGHRCWDGKLLTAKCAPCWALCSDYRALDVTTNDATKVTATSATLNGNLEKNGRPYWKKHPGRIDCEVWLEYGKTTSYGCSTSKVSKSSIGSFSAGISGLAEDTTYNFRAVASNGVGTDYGLDRNFTTTKIHHPPVACFTYLPQSPITIMFDASRSYDNDGFIIEYHWDFGDGVTGTGITYNHTYIANGTYNAKLTVMDNDNLTDTFTYNITIINVTSYDVCDFTDDIGLENLTLAHVLSLIDLFLDPSGFGSLDSIPPEYRPNGIIKNLTEDDINAVTEYYLGNITRGNYYANKSCGRVCVTVLENVKICAFDQNPAGYDESNEWVELYNPTNHTIDITNWKLKTRYSGGETVTVPEGSEIAPKDYWFFTCSTGFLRNENESITLMDSLDNEIDRTCNSSDFENNNRFCMRDPDCLDTDSDTDWIFQAQRLEKWKRRNGTVTYVVDGDTIDISPVERAYIQRIRLVGVNTPERGEQGYEEAKSSTMTNITVY